MTNRLSLHAASLTPERFQAAPESTAWTAAFAHNSQARPARSLTGACFDAAEFSFIAACRYAPPRFNARLSPNAGEFASGLLWRFARAGLSPAGRLALLWALELFQPAAFAAGSSVCVTVGAMLSYFQRHSCLCFSISSVVDREELERAVTCKVLRGFEAAALGRRCTWRLRIQRR